MTRASLESVPLRCLRLVALTRLLLLLDQSGIAFPAALRESDLYTPFAVRFRYEDLPEADASAAPFDRSHALGVASLAVGWAVGFSKV